MRFQVSFSSCLAAVAGMVLCAGLSAQAPAPDQSSQPAPASPAAGQSSSSSAQAPAPAAEPNGTYIAIDPLANVRYDNRYDVSVGMAYAHIKAGPNLLQGSNLGGLDISASYWLSKHWGVEGTGRPYLGTSGAAPNPVHINGPFVAQYIFAAGPEWLGPHNKHGALIAHVLAGGAYGRFEQDLRGSSPSVVGFYNDQVAPAVIMGGHMDLNRSPRWVFRITPDAILTRYGINYGPKTTQFDINFGISVGVEYKFKKTR
jgi:hypothetical protein